MGQLMSTLISLGLFAYLGVGAIAVLIWYTGAYFEPLKPPLNRIVLIAVVVVGYAVFALVRKLLRKRREKKLSADLAASTSVDPSRERSDEELATLKEKFDEALAILRSSGKGRFLSAGLYSLPWYMIIGPPGAGKTTLLVNSGLQFPLAEKMGLSKLQGVGGTRFCDWWFTDEAVILDTAGRYTTQDSDEQVDNAAWQGFLAMLRKNRRRRPINGIVVAISIDDVARQSEVDRERTANAIRLRIQELYEQLGVRFPVYVMFTKCDLLSGFMEFHGELDRHEREQVWGATFALNADPLESMEGELRLLQQQLQSRLVQRLQQERDPQRRNLIYNFPSLFDAAKPLVMDFMQRVFKPSRYTITPFLRGVYFTSGTQEGTPFNRLINQLARNFSLSNASIYSGTSKGKSFFIKDLLSKVIFGESGLAGANLKAERLYAAARTAGFVAIATVPVALIAIWFISAAGNRSMMDSLRVGSDSLHAQVEQVTPHSESLLTVLPLLNEARALPAGYAARTERVALSMKFGLYQGRRLAENLTVPAYRRLLENAFLSREMIRVESVLKENLGNPQVAYPALKTYLMLADEERLDPAYLKQWITTEWQQNFGRSLSREQHEQLTLHLDALLALRPFRLPFDLDRNLVNHVRVLLSETSHAQRAYAMIKSELITQGEEFTVANAGGPGARQALIRISGEPLNRGVPAMFSPPGYALFLTTQGRVLGEQEDEFWIFGTDASGSTGLDTTALSREVTRLYFRDYISSWWQFLEDIRIRPFSNFHEAAEILNIITGDESPLVLVLRGAAEQTDLVPDVALGGEDEGSLLQAVEQLFSSSAISDTAAVDPSVVDGAFKSLGDFVRTKDGAPSPVEGVRRDMEDLYLYVNTLAERGTGAVTAGAQQEINSAVDKLRLSARRAPRPLGDWITAVADQSEGLVAGRTMGMLDARWRSEVASFCQQSIANRYPFTEDGDAEVSLLDFGQFFGPAGKIDSFFNNYLAQYIDTNTNPWRVQSGVADIIEIRGETLRQLQLARKIQQAFFSQGGNLPAASFDLRPVRMDPDTTHFMLNLDGQRINYSHGPLVSETLNWPSNSSFSQAQIQFSPPTASGGSRTESGQWAWFRLLDKSNMQAGQGPEQFTLTFTLEDRWISYELRARSAFNPFNISQLRSFRCVPSL